MTVTLKAEKREILGKSSRLLRKKGLIPCTVYGTGHAPISFSADTKEIELAHKQAGESIVVALEVGGENYSALFRDYQKHPVTQELLSASFMSLKDDEKVIVVVPLTVFGVSMAVKNNIGFLVTPVSKIKVRCLPSKIPESFSIDISKLDEIGDTVFVKDLDLGEGVELAPGFDQYVPVASIVAPQKEEAKSTTTDTEVAATEAPSAGAATPAASDEGAKK